MKYLNKEYFNIVIRIKKKKKMKNEKSFYKYEHRPQFIILSRCFSTDFAHCVPTDAEWHNVLKSKTLFSWPAASNSRWI